ARLFVSGIEFRNEIARFIAARNPEDELVRPREVVSNENVLGRAIKFGPGESVCQRVEGGADPQALAIAAAASAPCAGWVGGREVIDVARAARTVVGGQHHAADLRHFFGASRASKTEYLRPDGPCDRLNLRLESERVGDDIARGLQLDQRKRQGCAAV